MSEFVKGKKLEQTPFHIGSPVTMFYKKKIAEELERIEGTTYKFKLKKRSDKINSDMLKDKEWKEEVIFVIIILNK